MNNLPSTWRDRALAHVHANAATTNRPIGNDVTIGIINLAADTPPPAPRDNAPPCTHCGNMRFLYNDKGRATPCRHCHLANQWRVAKLGHYSSANGRATHQTFANYTTTPNHPNHPAFIATRSWANDPTGWLLIYGPRGNGKSHLLAAAHNHILTHCIATAIYISMVDLTSSLKETLNDPPPEPYSTRLKRYQDCEVLILDDLGVEHGSEWVYSLYFELLDYRYRTRKPTLMSTNLDPTITTTDSYFDPRITSRWSEIGFSKLIANTAPDHRRTKTK